MGSMRAGAMLMDVTHNRSASDALMRMQEISKLLQSNKSLINTQHLLVLHADSVVNNFLSAKPIPTAFYTPSAYFTRWVGSCDKTPF